MNLKDLRDKSILILGMGREGKTTLEFLKKHFPEKEIGTTDQKDGLDYLDKLDDYDVIIKSPGVPYLPEIKKAKDDGKIITSATNIFFSEFKGKIIGVTGTKGKSTTASLIYEVLKNKQSDVHLVGNIGQPALELLGSINDKSTIVYELSSFQLENLGVSPHIAVITNIYPEHLDHHSDFSLYRDAKANITGFQKPYDYLLYNKDSQELEQIAQISKAKRITFTKKDVSWVKKLFGKEMLPLLGEMNFLNMIPAILIGRLYKISDANIRDYLIGFQPLPHRLEFVGEYKGRRFYNDSLSTIPQATIAGLFALGKRVQTLIAGGFDRGIDYTSLGEVIASSNIKTLILFPTTGEKIWNGVKKAVKSNLSISKVDVSSMEEAVKQSFEHTDRHKIVLLSPASASFNMFKDYEERGNQFKKWIKKLGAN